MKEALAHYRNPKSNTNNYSFSPKTDVVHAVTANKKAEFDGTVYSFVLHDLNAEEIQRLRNLRKSAERIEAEAAVIKPLQPWLRGERIANRPA
jgi:hypothetical protein